MIDCHFCTCMLKQKVRARTGFSASAISENFLLVHIVRGNALVGDFSSTERCRVEDNPVATRVVGPELRCLISLVNWSVSKIHLGKEFLLPPKSAWVKKQEQSQLAKCGAETESKQQVSAVWGSLCLPCLRVPTSASTCSSCWLPGSEIVQISRR